MNRKHSLWTHCNLLLGATLLAVHPLALAAADTEPTLRERYLQERSNCLAGKTRQSQQDCLREAGAAYAEARRHGLGHEDPARLAANAFARCEYRPPDQKEMCMRMVRGEGTVTGSVDEGGFVREIVTVVKDGDASSGR